MSKIIADIINKHLTEVYKFDFKEEWKKRCEQYDILKQPYVLPAVKRIIVLGDIHGDLTMLYEMLKVAKVINDKLEWIGGETVVVQVGDQVDRCRYYGKPCNMEGSTPFDEGSDWKILKFMTDLHKKAQEKGGAVYSLVGNHELMNVDGDFRYVSFEGLREFDNFDLQKEGLSSITKESKPDTTDGKELRKWAFHPGNPVSNFMACTRLMAIIIGSNLFVHAGILPGIAKKYGLENTDDPENNKKVMIKNLNQLLSLYLWGELEKIDEIDETIRNDLFKNPKKSPLWNRVFGNLGLKVHSAKGCSNKELNEIKKQCTGLLQPLKDLYQVDKLYIGHTPLLDNGIGSVCDGKVWLTDYGSSRAFDVFDETTTSEPDGTDYKRGENRTPQVLEILEDGRIINVLK